MARHVFSVLCRRSITDQGSNLLSLIDVLDGIAVASPALEHAAQGDMKPALTVDANLISQFTRSDIAKGEDFEVRVLLTGPGGEKIGGTNAHIDLHKFQNFRMASRFTMLPFTGSGRYEFKVQLQDGSRWRTAASIPLAVTVQAQTDEAASN